MSEAFFFDTYALIEVIRGNQKYARYNKTQAYVTLFNLGELNYILKKEMPKHRADEYTSNYSAFETEVQLDDIKKAGDFKIQNKRLSFADCVGYIVAQRLGIKFLTGDEGFERMSNVEYVKK